MARPGAHWSAVPQALESWARARPDTVALALPSRRVTFVQWWTSAVAIGNNLASACPRGSLVAIPAGSAQWVEFALAYVGAQLAGCIPFPLKPDLTRHEWDTVRAACAPAAVIALPGIGVEHPREPVLPFAEMVISRGSEAPPAPLPTADVLLTSGTTGRPRAVVTSHAELLSVSRLPPNWHGRALLHTMPPASAAGVQGAMLLALLSGIEARTVEQPSVVDVAAFADELDDPIVVAMYVVPAVAVAITKYAARSVQPSGRWEHIRMVLLTGSAAPPHVLHKLTELFPRASIVNLYGATEAGTAQTMMPYRASRPASVGRAVGSTEVNVLRADGSRAAAGEAGEIVLRRTNVPPRRYLGDPQANASVFLAGGWVRTGDLGFLDGDGYLYILDRSKDVVIRGGENVSTPEVEEVLMAHPAVRDAAVIGEATNDSDEALVAFVVSDGPVDVTELRAHVRARLAAVKVPSRIVVVSSLPRNSMGKVDKRQLRGRGDSSSRRV